MSEAAAPDAASLRSALERVLGDDRLAGGELRGAQVAAVDRWLIDRFDAATGGSAAGFALVAVGSYGRRAPSPRSDLDLVLLHADADRAAVESTANSLWYPIWDAKVPLDHSVRTVAEARRVAGEDLRAALGMLDLRHVAGDEALSGEARRLVYDDWRRQAPSRLPELAAAAAERAAAHGELAFLLEPDLKLARGGIRDVLALRAAAAAWVVDAPAADVVAAYEWLLDVRAALQRRTGRTTDKLVMQEHAPVAAALGVTEDELSRRISAAGRTIDFALDETWRRVANARRSQRRLGLRRRAGPQIELLDDGVILAGGEVTLAKGAAPEDDPMLGLRVAAAAAQHDLPIATPTVRRLSGAPPLPEPWPAHALRLFVSVLEAGRATIRVLEAVDRAGLLVGWLPEWENVRFRQQYDPIHRFTVDRHLMETTANVAPLARRVSRPDLLVLGALLHDIGKGSPGDHTEVGVRLTPPILRRMGLPARDVETVTALVRHHLLLPDTATRRDPADPATISLVSSAVGDSEQLDLLHALTEADAQAAGPAAGTDWKAALVADLVRRTHRALGGHPPEPPTSLDDDAGRLAAVGEFGLVVGPGVAGARVTVAARDRPGLLWRWAAVLALHRLEILSATAAAAASDGGEDMAITSFDVRPSDGAMPDASVLRHDLQRVIDDPLPVQSRLAARERSRPRDAWSALVAPPHVLWADDASVSATVVQVRAHDSAGLLSRLARVLAEADLSVRQARIQTLGAEVVDSFYVVDPAGNPVTDPGVRSSLGPKLLAACGSGAEPAPG